MHSIFGKAAFLIGASAIMVFGQDPGRAVAQDGPYSLGLWGSLSLLGFLGLLGS